MFLEFQQNLNSGGSCSSTPVFRWRNRGIERWCDSQNKETWKQEGDLPRPQHSASGACSIFTLLTSLVLKQYVKRTLLPPRVCRWGNSKTSLQVVRLGFKSGCTGSIYPSASLHYSHFLFFSWKWKPWNVFWGTNTVSWQDWNDGFISPVRQKSQWGKKIKLFWHCTIQ